MRTKLMINKILNARLFWFLVLIGPMLTTANIEAAEKKETEPPLTLTVKGMEGKLALYHTIKVRVENLDKWVEQPGHDPSKFILHIDGNAFAGLTPTIMDNSMNLQFDLKRTTESKDAWTAVLSRKPKAYTRNVPVTVRQEDVKVQGYAKASLVVINKLWFWIFVVTFLASIALFWTLAMKSDIIRVVGSQPKGIDKKEKPHRKPYSLARTQMAFWFFIVLISYVYIWMVTSDLSNLTPQVLALIGISAATGLSSAIVDSNKRGDQENQMRAFEEKKKDAEVGAEKLRNEIDTHITALNATKVPQRQEECRGVIASKQAELAAKKKEIEQTDEKLAKLSDAAKPRASKGFINDILSDDGGISFYRFQMFAWTIVLIFIFIASVYNVLSMPNFDATLLALMGISGGTYIGFKLPEQQG